MNNNTKKHLSRLKQIEKLLQEFQKTHNITNEELKETLQLKEKESFPIQILRTKELSSLEAIVKYLRENKKKSYKEIGLLLNRNPFSLASTYKSAKIKKPETYKKEIESDDKRIYFSVFQKNLSVLEAICTYLRNSGLKYSEIGHLLNKDQRTVWTVCNRAKKKLGGVNNE